jgi:branched-subunit amino acid ABC-type transport system permease component
MGVAVGIDKAVVVVGGSGSVDGCIVGLAAMGMVNKWHHFFRLGAQT